MTRHALTHTLAALCWTVLALLALSGCMVDGSLPTGSDPCPDVVVYMTFDTLALTTDSIVTDPLDARLCV